MLRSSLPRQYAYAFLGLLMLAPLAAAQTPIPAAQPKPAIPAVYTPTSLEAEPGLPRTPDGHPDFQGAVWATNYFPVMESTPLAATLVVSDADAKKIAGMMAQGLLSSKDDNIKVDPEVEVIIGASDGLPVVRGQRRSRMLVLPADGKLPLTPDARERMKKSSGALGAGAAKLDNIEDRDSSERCLEVGGQPPLAMIVSYNRLQLIQTPSHVVIHTEAGDETRIVPFASTHGASPASWLGDSIARWEGDTLVVETTKLRVMGTLHAIPSYFLGPDSTVTERFTRLSASELLYQFTIEDPKFYSAPWLAEYSFSAVKTGMYPSPCHEGNYSLPNILKAARVADARGATPQAKP